METVIFPQLKEIVAHIYLNCFSFTPKMKNGQNYLDTKVCKEYIKLYSMNPKNYTSTLSTPHDQTEIGIMGLDIIVDQNYKVWLLEINALCNLKHKIWCKTMLFFVSGSPCSCF